jgi:hypothetical protein
VSGWALLVAAALAGPPARPAPRPAPAAAQAAATVPAGRVTIEVQVVHASDSADGVDPRLKSLASSLRYLKFKGYRLLSAPSATLKAGADASFPLEGGRELSVTLVERDDARARVRVRIVRGAERMLDTTVSINRDGTFIVAGPAYEDGILVLPLRAHY